MTVLGEGLIDGVPTRARVIACRGEDGRPFPLTPDDRRNIEARVLPALQLVAEEERRAQERGEYEPDEIDDFDRDDRPRGIFSYEDD